MFQGGASCCQVTCVHTHFSVDIDVHNSHTGYCFCLQVQNTVKQLIRGAGPPRFCTSCVINFGGLPGFMRHQFWWSCQRSTAPVLCQQANVVSDWQRELLAAAATAGVACPLTSLARQGGSQRQLFADIAVAGASVRLLFKMPAVAMAA